MALEQILSYVFTPSITVGNQQYSATLAIPGRWNIGQIRRIVNSTRNKLMYSDEHDKLIGTIVFSSYNATVPAGSPTALIQKTGGVTTFNLLMDTSYMQASDVLGILVEKKEQIVRPFDFGTDAIERMRVSNPKSMIDADFEYGLQPTKWASYGLNRLSPSIFELQSNDLIVTAATTDWNTTSTTNSLITLTITGITTGISANTPIHVGGTSNVIAGNGGADGGFMVVSSTTGGGNTTITYRAKCIIGTSNGASLFRDGMILRRCVFSTGATFNFTIPISTVTGAITVTTSTPHGFVPGMPILVREAAGTTIAGTNLAQLYGSYYIESVTAPNTFTYTPRTDSAGARNINVTTAGAISFTLNSDGLAAPRPWDGGVLIYTASGSHGASIIRSTKKYNRYQSGKGYLWSSGTLFRPNYDISSITGLATTTLTVTTDFVPHGLQTGATVLLTGLGGNCDGQFTVASITSAYVFTVTSPTNFVGGAVNPGASPKVQVIAWDGAVVRGGPFDEQNGLFFEYDGRDFWVVRRSAVEQVPGLLGVTNGSNTVNFIGAASFVRPGDKIVIKGMTYLVTNIPNSTTASITPAYRGTTISSASGVKANIVRELRVKQSDWNLDKCDGTNPESGFSLNLNRMQMVGIQYSWYGAGFVDFMIRGLDGNWIKVHRMVNNNVNFEAYMRSGNLPVRYSVENESYSTYITADPGAAGTTIEVASTANFPNSGTILIDQEIITYSGKTPTSFTGCLRGQTVTKFQGGLSRVFSGSSATAHGVPVPTSVNGPAVFLFRNTCSPALVHWGSALIMDGGFDSDRGYIFNAQRTIDILGAATSTNKRQAFALRLAPSVSSGLVGDLGARELINRAQFLLDTIGVDVDNAVNARAIIVEGIVNPTNLTFGAGAWVDVNSVAQGSQPSFTQIAQTFNVSGVANTTNNNGCTGGETIFSFALPTPAGSTALTSGAVNDRLDLTELKELTNSPLGGNGVYPDGPEVLVIQLSMVGTGTGTASATVLCRWSEAQA